jgi:hypothetical protein
VFTFSANEAFGTRTSASTLAADRDDVNDVAFVVVTHASKMSLAIESEAPCAPRTRRHVELLHGVCCTLQAGSLRRGKKKRADVPLTPL